MTVLKFGGSSVGTPERVRGVADIIAQSHTKHGGKIVVVVSAFGGVTDQLIALARQAAAADKQYLVGVEELAERHCRALETLIPDRAAAAQYVGDTLEELRAMLRGIFLIREVTPKILDAVMSVGERLSAHILAETLESRGLPAFFVDVRALIRTNNAFGNALVDFEITNPKIQEYLDTHPGLPVITGFIGSTAKGETSTLGRGGSDYTAAIVGAALGAEVIEIWTDVTGVMTADPRIVPEAVTIPTLSYEEVMELSHFGAKVIYPPTVQPALAKSIPIHIKNTFDLNAAGTVIKKEMRANGEHVVRGITSIRNVALLRLEGSGMVGVTGIASRLFGTLAEHKINVILITQASSEHSICFALVEADATDAAEAVNQEFSLEILAERVNPLVVEREQSIVAVVGEQMRHMPGVAGRLFGALGEAGVNVVAIAQGSSELNISIVVDRQDEAHAVRTLHETFFAPQQKTLHIFLVGTGLVGSTLLKQMRAQLPTLKEEYGIALRIVGLANSKSTLIDERSIDLGRWQEQLARGEVVALDQFVARMEKLRLPESVFVDCTASEAVGEFYPRILKAGMAVVTPNKKANSGPLATYLAIREAAQKSGAQFFYETNVGAALPVISTLQDLVRSGDTILKIEGVLSGTLSYLFNTFSVGDERFSELVRMAKERGYTEPDPRDDLSGMDVARKILILARETGLELELKDVVVESLVPEDCCAAATTEEFLEKLAKHDGEWSQRREEARQQGKALRYVAKLEDGKATVGLVVVGPGHPLYSLSGSDNMISFTTERYREQPLVIRGPGAGAEVTAGGVFADILRTVL